MIMKARVTASQKLGPFRLRRRRGGAVDAVLRLGPITWTWPLHSPRRRTVAERRADEVWRAQRAAGRRLVLALTAAGGFLAAAIAGAAWPWLALTAAVALVAGAGWARRRHTLPDEDGWWQPADRTTPRP
jgi:hypothetical protein